jgi:hypothetical protein
MTAPPVWTFFYGSYLNFDVLAEVGMAPARWEVASLPGFELVIRPRANLVRSERGLVYGIVAACTHAELTRLYAHAHDVLGETYLPEPVLAHLAGGAFRPALCYIAPSMEPRPADGAYVERIAQPARRYGFPAWYLDHIESFR